MIPSECNYVIVGMGRYRKDPGENIFFTDAMIRSECSNYVIAIIARYKKESWGRYIFS